MVAKLLAAMVAASCSSGPPSGNRVNKHTHSSNDGEGDYKFVNKYICDADTSSASKSCAVDMKASCDGFDLHMVQSFITPNGTETPNEWFSYMSELHGDMQTFDQFMHLGTTFYASDLTQHLEAFKSDGVKFMARKHSSSGMYSLLVSTASAKVLEITSDKKPSSSSSLFTEWGSDECPSAHVWSNFDLTNTTTTLRASSSLPSLTAIGVNIAATATSVKDIGPWLEKYKISGSKATVETDGACTFANIEYSNAVVRYVNNPSAKIGSRTVEDYEKYQMGVHAEYVGQNKGWDAFMDNHWCVGVSHSQYLDETAKLWAADNVSWHAHKTPRVSSVRSVGHRGESIELNGLIDGSYLKHLSGFDFCTPCTEKSC